MSPLELSLIILGSNPEGTIKNVTELSDIVKAALPIQPYIASVEADTEEL